MTITVTPLDAPLGAEISGIDLHNITLADKKAIFDAWMRYHVVVVHGPVIHEDDLVEYAKCFGEIEGARFKSPLTRRDDIMVISNIREDGVLLGSLPDGEMAFHFDRIHQKKPCRGASLHALEIPREGGDTCFANMVLAYETLPEATKKRLVGLTALNAFTYGSTQPDMKGDPAKGPHAHHPVARTIPQTGRKALCVSRLMTERINELPEEESRALLDELCDHVERPENIYQHKWRVGDIVVWDNRATSHARTDFSDRERRLMKRVTIADDAAPVA